MTKDNQTSPSAFIPFCDFGGNMSVVGVRTKMFDQPVCNSFEAKILNDQVCYEIDLQKYRNKENTNKELKLGLTFILDYNEDRQVTFNDIPNMVNDEDDALISSKVDSEMTGNAVIYINTIGMN